MAKTKHKDESGRPSVNRGKPPHKGGFHASMKGVNPSKTWWEYKPDNFVTTKPIKC